MVGEVKEWSPKFVHLKLYKLPGNFVRTQHILLSSKSIMHLFQASRLILMLLSVTLSGVNSC